jgi:hypothetical protein
MLVVEVAYRINDDLFIDVPYDAYHCMSVVLKRGTECRHALQRFRFRTDLRNIKQNQVARNGSNECIARRIFHR